MAYDPSQYEAQRRGLMQNYAATNAANAYSNFLSRQRGQRGLSDLQTSFQQAAPQVVSGYGRRGLNGPNVHSGIFTRALADFAKNATTQQSQAQQELDQSQNLFGLQQKQSLEGYNQALQDLEAQKARDMAADAQSILQYRAGM